MMKKPLEKKKETEQERVERVRRMMAKAVGIKC